MRTSMNCFKESKFASMYVLRTHELG